MLFGRRPREDVETAVEGASLCKSFQDEARGLVRAVINVSFRVERGEVLGYWE